MNICIIDTSEAIPENTTTNVHLTNCFIIKRYLEEKKHSVDFFVSSSKIDNKKQYDIVLVSYASMYFDVKKFITLIENQKKAEIGWMTNDYNLSPNSSLSKKFDFIISNHQTKLKAFQDKKQLISNLNSLVSYKNHNKNKNKYNLCYYGTYRPDREKYFLKYFKSKEIIVSCNTKNLKKFKHIGCTSSFTNKFTWELSKETLRLFTYSLYIEDEKTHSHYSMLANRFYESISCGSLPVFDKSCLNSIEKSIYEIPKDLIIDGLNDYKKIDAKKHQAWLEKTKEDIIKEKNATLEEIEDFLIKIKPT